MIKGLEYTELEPVLTQLVDSARTSLKQDLVSVVLFGSAAENRLRLHSDVNLLFILERFPQIEIDALRDSLRIAMASLGVRAMFLLHSELPIAAELFSVKFNDIRTRHRVLYGADLFANLDINESNLRRRLREELLNLAIRLRGCYAMFSLREEQLVSVIAHAAGPLRASAAALMRLKGVEAPTPREAMEQLISEMGEVKYIEAMKVVSRAREETFLPPGVAGTTLLALSSLAEYLLRALEGDEA